MQCFAQRAFGPLTQGETRGQRASVAVSGMALMGLGEGIDTPVVEAVQVHRLGATARQVHPIRLSSPWNTGLLWGTEVNPGQSALSSFGDRL